MRTNNKYKDKRTALKAKYRSINASNKALRVGVSFRLDKEKDKDILEYLKGVTDKVGFFRRLIREEMGKNNGD